MATFLNKPITEAEVTKLESYLRIENFKKNPAVNQGELKEVKILSSTAESFVRNGKTVIAGWQKEYTPKIIERVEKWMTVNLKNTDMRFPDS